MGHDLPSKNQTTTIYNMHVNGSAGTTSFPTSNNRSHNHNYSKTKLFLNNGNEDEVAVNKIPSRNSMEYNINGNVSLTNQNTMRNVHFSPVVSQLRYVPVKLQETTNYINGSSSSGFELSERTPQKVKVHVQRIEPPLHQFVERVQICVPQDRNEHNPSKLVLDFNDLIITNSTSKTSVPFQNKNEERYVTSINQMQLDQEQGNPKHSKRKWDATTGSRMEMSEKENDEKLFKSTTTTLETSPFELKTTMNKSGGKGEVNTVTNKHNYCNVLLRENPIPDTKSWTMPQTSSLHVTNSNNETTYRPQGPVVARDCRFERNFPGIGCLDKSGNSEAADIIKNFNSARQNVHNIGSLESLDAEEGKHFYKELEVEEFDESESENATCKGAGRSKGHSWPNAYRKFKEKSKPKLSFLQRITFGRFGNNSKAANTEKEDGLKKVNKKSQKRSSCPPLGHPILLNSKLCSRDCENCNINESDVIRLRNVNPTSEVNVDPYLKVTTSTKLEELDEDNIDPESTVILRTESSNQAQYETPYFMKQEAEVSEPFSIANRFGNNDNKLPFDYNLPTNPHDLPPKPSPRQRKSSQASNSSGYSSVKRTTYQNDQSDSDELSLTFERIMESITGLDAHAANMTEAQSDFILDEIQSLTSSQVEELDQDHLLGESETGSFAIKGDDDDGDGSNAKPLQPVKGKPPIPPLSANRLSGMRTGERLSFLRGRMSATAFTETRLAIELAAKLSEFRKELHRSRQDIANSGPDLDEIENSVRISMSMAIDPTERTLPQSRNLTKVSLPLMPPVLSHNINVSPAFTSSPSGTCTSGTCPKEQDQPAKPITEIIKEEWESVVLRAKENFSRSPHYRHFYNNNGRSADPLRSKGIVLETDLDSGASLGYPVENSYNNFGDGDRNEELGEVLRVEDVASATGPFYFVQRNSCSLQNLSNCGGFESTHIKMATLTPGDPGGGNGKEDRSRSMEFLLDSEKNAHLRPPENTLMKNQETRRMSEHELRVQRSLQKLNVPDWYKTYSASGTASAAGTPSKTRDFGSGSGLAGGWPGLSSSKTSSLTSLQSAGRYAGSKSGFGYGRHRATGAASAGGRSSRDSLMSPSSTASASPSPNFERSSFTYGMPYALTRFATTRMSCGASPASLSPSPSPVGGIGTSTSTPVSSGPAARYGYQKAPYLGWRSQERLASKSLYRSPAERLAADLIAQKVKPPPAVAPVVVEIPPPPEIEVKTSPKKEIASSDLSLNNSEESNSHKLNRVRSSIKEVSNAIVDYVNETKPLDDGMNGRASPRRGLVWLESSFVGTKPIDSPGTPDTPSTFMSHRGSRKDSAFRFDETSSNPDRTKDGGEVKSGESSSTSYYASYVSRNEQMEERSNSSSVSSPTLEDILDSLLALRRPNKKFRSRGKGHDSTPKSAAAVGGEEDFRYTSKTSVITSSTIEDPPRTTSVIHTLSSSSSSRHPASSYHQYDYEPSTTSEIYSTAITSSTKNRYQEQTPPTSASEWQDRFNQPLADSTFTFGEPETFTLTGTSRKTGANSGALITSSNSNSNNNYSSYEKSHLDRYSSASGTSGVGMNESVCSSSSSANVIHSASSSMHSTPTHQKYQSKQQQQHNQSPPAVATSSTAVGSSKDYYCSSTSSSPAKSCLVDSTQHRDDNELRQTSHSGGGGTGVGDDEDELAFGNPTEIRSTVTSSSVAPVTGGVIVNPLTGLSEYSNPPTPARHRRVSFDLDFSDKEEKSSSRSRNKDENVGGTIQCRNTKCGKTATGLEARREFKVCHNCNAYYCSRECRRAHWEKHKKTCMQSRVGAICKQIISHVKEDSYVMNQLSTVAKRGFLAKGRGCVKLFFNSADRAERFLSGGLPELPEPLYIPHSDMLPEEMGAQTFSELSDQCRSYNPETRFVLYACVCVVNEVPTYGAVKWERELISRSSKLRLLLPRNFYEETQRLHHPPANPAHLMSALQDPSNSGRTSPATPGLQAQQPHVPLYDSVTPSAVPSSDDFPPPLPPHQNTVTTTTTTTSENDTLILRSVPPPSSHQLNSQEHKRLREVSFTNIQKHLLLRGVDLKRTYPDIYMKLCKYVEHDEPFLPVTIYPRNNETGRQFVCVIMPESSDSAYTAATEESVQRHPLQRVETINISEPDDDDVLDLT